MAWPQISAALTRYVLGQAIAAGLAQGISYVASGSVGTVGLGSAEWSAASVDGMIGDGGWWSSLG